ncbi:MAG: uracil-DNA glycosylase [Thermodesulfobacteriota bacterium]|nr:uracil-DNA glycosylase [Thermodesulfobacteriota bacterium]
MNKSKSQTARPNCFHCSHFYITYESAHPYGCRAVGFKSALFPAAVVYANSGMECLMFSEKKKYEGKAEEIRRRRHGGHR